VLKSVHKCLSTSLHITATHVRMLGFAQYSNLHS